ncbi:MAG TPA: HAD family hydrolase, partial [Azospira sp.]|nr:HAD family hydrolase [Azospira sp.]
MRLHSATFDLDGTLVDSIPDLAAACHAMLAELGQLPRSDDDIHRFVGKGMAVLVERCLTWESAPQAALLEAGIAAFRRHYAEMNGRASSLYPGVVDGLEAFRARGLRLG